MEKWPERQREVAQMKQLDGETAGPVILAEGIMADTRIATPQGWRAAGDLLVSDTVLTFESGVQKVDWVWRSRITDAEVWPLGFWPLHVPVGALDNREALVLLAEQRVLVESDGAEALYGDPFALIPARVLEGYRGISRCRPPEGAGLVLLGFAEQQILYASRAALLVCPGCATAEARAHYPPLTTQQAHHLVACLMAEDVGLALRAAGQAGQAGQGQAAFF